MAVSSILPDWVTKYAPEVTVPELFYYNAETGSYIVTEDGQNHEFKDIEPAYDFARENDIEFEFKGKFPGTKGFISVPDEEDESGGMLMTNGGQFLLSSGMLMTNGGQLLLSRSRTKDIKYLESKFTNWYEIVDAYDNDPEEFIKSYRFIHSHPILWVKSDRGPFSWETSEWAVNAEAYASSDKDSGSYWLVEVFEHINYDSLRLEASGLKPEEGYLKTYGHNPEMSACANNINDAYIEVAKKIRSHYPLDGTPTEDW